MLNKAVAFTKKKALTIIFVCALVLFIAILAKWLYAYRANETGLSTLKGREAFITELGWEIDSASEECKSVTLPEALDGVMRDYNEMQLKQGYDLRRYLGQGCTRYTYRVTNYSGYEGEVYITLYIKGQRVIAGDIHTNALDGFMHGIKQSEKE